jgi:thioredoxin 1
MRKSLIIFIVLLGMFLAIGSTGNQGGNQAGDVGTNGIVTPVKAVTGGINQTGNMTGNLTANQIGMDGNVPGGTKPALMYFFSTGCENCRMQKPIIEELGKKYGDKVNFNLIDVDENQQLATKYGINAVPVMIILKNDVEVKRFFGVTEGSVLESELNKNL